MLLFFSKLIILDFESINHTVLKQISFLFVQLPMCYWFEFSIFLFSLGLCGIFFNNHNFLTVLLNIEVMLLGVGLLYIGFSVFFFEPKGQMYALIILVLAAAESCLGLSLLVSLFRSRRSITQLELTHLSN
jgi:NADH-quinone oxidoreductase subunit K